jgi:hypothetical protein
MTPLRRSLPVWVVCATGAALVPNLGKAAAGDIGTGIPHFGSYGAAMEIKTIVWSLADATIAMDSGCQYLVLTQATLGPEGYKVAMATLLAAKLSNRRVRFYAHAPRDGGCGVDYVQLQ